MEIEAEELTCDEAERYYDGYLNRTLPVAIDKRVMQHLAKCEVCYNRYIDWTNTKTQPQKKEKQEIT